MRGIWLGIRGLVRSYVKLSILVSRLRLVALQSTFSNTSSWYGALLSSGTLCLFNRGCIWRGGKEIACHRVVCLVGRLHVIWPSFVTSLASTKRVASQGHSGWTAQGMTSHNFVENNAGRFHCCVAWQRLVNKRLTVDCWPTACTSQYIYMCK
jgi:hypothetical protein